MTNAEVEQELAFLLRELTRNISVSSIKSQINISNYRIYRFLGSRGVGEKAVNRLSITQLSKELARVNELLDLIPDSRVTRHRKPPLSGQYAEQAFLHIHSTNPFHQMQMGLMK